MRNIAFSVGILLLPCLIVGCQQTGNRKLVPDKKPRPVETQVLELGSPPSSALVSAAVASWKTEQIGFEVSGRVKSVAEPNTSIEAHTEEVVEIVNGQSQVVVQESQGTRIAQIEDDRYQLQYEIAEAKIDQATLAFEAAKIELEQSLTSQIDAAQADSEFASAEFERTERLWKQNALPKSDYDRAKASSDMAAAKVKQLNAALKAKESEVVSLQLEIKQARQSLRDAKRNLEDCELFSSFRGQIADVFVVPGSVVSAGTPVATVQMMNPIKVELEVSAEESRALQGRLLIPVWVSQSSGAPKVRENGFLYLIDPVADPQTRTFTVTLLVLNRKSKFGSDVGEDIPVTDQAWRLNLPFLPGAEQGLTFIPERAVRKDSEGHFLWRVTNLNIGDQMPPDSLLTVQKMRVELGKSKLPFLGNWFFQQVSVLDPTFDPQVNLVAGRLMVKSGEPDDWNGDRILVNRSSQWMLRPGDVVEVDLSRSKPFVEEGFFVPMDAIARKSDKTFLFVVEDTGSPGAGENGSTGQVVKRVEVDLVDFAEVEVSSMREIKPVGEASLAGKRYVTHGVHYLRDGEPVRVTDVAGAGE